MYNYTLYDVFGYSKENIINSIGIEYNSLNITSIRIILINNLRSYDLLDSDSISVLDNSNFFYILSNSDSLKHNNNMYLLDKILFTINSKSSLNLILKFGSDYSKSLSSLISSINLTDLLLVDNVGLLQSYYNITSDELNICHAIKSIRHQYPYKYLNIKLSRDLINLIISINKKCALKQLIKLISKVGNIDNIDNNVNINDILKYTIKYYVLSYNNSIMNIYRDNIRYLVYILKNNTTTTTTTITNIDYIREIYDYVYPKIEPTFNMLYNSNEIIMKHNMMLSDAISYISFNVINESMLHNNKNILFLLKEAISSNAPTNYIDLLFKHSPFILDKQKYTDNLRALKKVNQIQITSLFD